MVWHGRIILLAIAAMFLVGGASAFLSGYGYYQDATINNTGSNLTNYQVMFVVNTSSGTSSSTTLYLNSHSESDLDDLRFTDTSDNIYDYWIESTSNPYNVWVEVPSITTGNTTIRVQYGNAAASAYSNGTNTFLLFDDFEGYSIGSTASPPWVIDAAGFTVSDDGGGNERYGSTSASAPVSYQTISVTDNIRIDSKIKHGDTNYLMQLILGNTSWYWGVYGYSSKLSIYRGGAEVASTAISPSISTWYDASLWRRGTEIGVYFNGTTKTYTDASPYSTTKIGVRVGGTNQDGWANNIRVRNYVSTEPTVPAWTAESASCTAVTPVAAFSANTTSGYAPLSVLFTDASTNTPTSWAWSWGDGTANGTTQNPNHTYSTGGTYNVTLTATNCGGSDSETKLAYISVYTLVAFPGCAAVPTDIDADGLYEDINGNTRKDWSDIILFFKYRIWAAANEPPDAFDWNSNGIIDYKDVLMLYDEGV